jgi:hypothetical protein
MTVDRRLIRFLNKVVVLAGVCSPLVFACAPIQGYPRDPENTDATLTALQPYFDGTEEKVYLATSGDAARAQIRNEIIF